MKQVQKFLVFNHPSILWVIRGFYLSNDRDLCHIQFPDLCDWGITSDAEYYEVFNLASITDDQIIEIEKEIECVVNYNAAIQEHNTNVVGEAISVLKSLDNTKLSEYLDKHVSLPSPDYTKWIQYDFIGTGKVRKYVECAKRAIDLYHIKENESDNNDVLVGEAIAYLVQRGKKFGIDFTIDNAVSYANRVAGELEFERIIADNPTKDFSSVDWTPHKDNSFKNAEIYLWNRVN